MGVTIRSSSRGLPEPDINVTPLVDVVLVLLIIFMVIAPEPEQGARVDLPRPRRRDAKHADPITVSLTADGRTFLEKTPVEAGELGGPRAVPRGRPSRKAIVKGDSGSTTSACARSSARCRRRFQRRAVVGTRDDRAGARRELTWASRSPRKGRTPSSPG